MVSVVQREWAAKNPRATEDVLNSRMIAYPFRLLQCCLVTDGGRLDPDLCPARPRLFAEAGLPARHRRECRDADGEPRRVRSASPVPRPLPKPPGQQDLNQDTTSSS